MKERDTLSKFKDKQLEVEQEAREMGEMLAKSYADYTKIAEGRTVGKHERDDMISSHVEDMVSRYHHDRAGEELEQYHVWWDEITAEHIVALKRALKNARREEDIQRFLNNNKIFLVQHLGGGHGRYVIPKKKLGAELIPDFLVAEMSSIGLEWHGVELESPSAQPFTASGQFSSKLNHAIHQVEDWRTWISNNGGYARRPKSEDGLGLIGINANIPATILIGRRVREFPSNFNAYRTEKKQKLNIEIHTYDWLVEQAEYRVQSLGESGRLKH